MRPPSRLLLIGALALLAACSGGGDDRSGPVIEPAGQAILPLPGSTDHVGSTVCGQCHRQALADWRGSDHQLAMQRASAASVLGDFDSAQFENAGVSSRFAQRGGRHIVSTDGPDGAPAEFEIAYTFGHYPLQQYLVEQPGGRLQALGLAWDSRAQNMGGQRWFHLYPDLPLAAGQRLHWTGRDQNWNFMCAECHTTGLRKGYDARTDSYRSTWTELGVGCEGCHGPGLAHARWASEPDAGVRAADPDKGLGVQFHERRGASWLPLGDSGNRRREPARDTRLEIDACGRCHGRASRLGDDPGFGQSLLASHRPALLDPDQYEPDGQMRGEVFNWGSFLQSRMYAAGVTCSDCHQPHSLSLRAEGNALCARCHDPGRFDQPSHSHHAPDSTGARCVSCHMPSTTFMQVDARHDHAFRIPRPDRGMRLGTRDACTDCHADRDATWAAAQLAQWFPDSPHRREGFAEALAAAANGAPDARARLLGLLADPDEPAIARASALRAALPWLDAEVLAAATLAAGEPEPLLRMAGLEVLAEADPAARIELLAASLDDPVTAVRLQALEALAGPAEAALDARRRERFEQVLAEYLAALEFNAERPDAVVSLGDLQLRRGQSEPAEAAYRRALTLDPGFSIARLRLAELLRLDGRETEAEASLREALARAPEEAGLQHALGLSLVRQRRGEEALAALRRAAQLEPAEARYAYVLAVALHDLGRVGQARAELARALAQHPQRRELLMAAAVYALRDGDAATAQVLAQRMLERDRNDAQAHQLLQWIRSGKAR